MNLKVLVYLKRTSISSINIDHQNGSITLRLKSINNLSKNLTVKKVILLPSSVANSLKIENSKQKYLGVIKITLEHIAY